MWDPLTFGTMPSFWPPRANGFWRMALEPLRRYYLRRYYAISQVDVEGMEALRGKIPEGDGVLLAPNHSHDSDPHVMMEVAHQAGRCFYFMAAWQIFKMHWGIDGFVLARMGAFSVDREGCDRRAMAQAKELLTNGKYLVVFPEGEVFHLNQRLTPLREGVAFMALSAQRDLEKEDSSKRIWIVPAAIRYRYVDDIRPKLEAAMTSLESRLVLKPTAGTPLHKRIIRYGEFLLTLKEKERLGHSCESEGTLAQRLSNLSHALLDRLEAQYLEAKLSEESVPARVKHLRRALLERFTDETAEASKRAAAREALDEVQLVLQLYSYPGDYVAETPSIERMAETIEKFEEDLQGFALPKGKRRARVILGEPIDLKQETGAGRHRKVVGDVTAKLEEQIQQLMRKANEIPVAV